MVRWMHDRVPGEMRAHVRGQLRVLREQMKSHAAAPAEPPLTVPNLDDDELD